jgi:hypothetical protein
MQLIVTGDGRELVKLKLFQNQILSTLGAEADKIGSNNESFIYHLWAWHAAVTTRAKVLESLRRIESLVELQMEFNARSLARSGTC